MAERPITVITHRVFPETVAILQDWTELRLKGEASWPADEVHRLCRDASAMMAFIPDSVTKRSCGLPGLKDRRLRPKGYDNFDVEACTRRGVWITIVDDLLTIPIRTCCRSADWYRTACYGR